MFKYNEDLIYINICLILFNLLPIYPLDGFNVLLEILKIRYDLEYSIDVICFIDWIFCIILTFLIIIMNKYLYLLFIIYFIIQFRSVKNIRENYYLDRMVVFKM